MSVDGTTPVQQQSQQPVNQPAVDPDAIRAEVVREIFGDKYKSAEDAKVGYWNLNNYASQAYRALEERVNPGSLADQRAADPFAILEQESLVKGDVLRNAIRAEAAQLIKQEFQPLQNAWQARQQLATTAPDYLANEPAIMAWLQKNPQVNEKVERLNRMQAFDIAAEVALTHWRTANPPSSPGNAEQKGQAMLPNSQTMQGRALEQAPNREEQLMQAIQYGHMSGDRRAAYTQVFPDFTVQLPPHLADQFAQR